MKWKIHLFVITAIIVSMTLLFVLFKPAPPTPIVEQVPSSPYTVRMVHAHWGLNCNELYEATMKSMPKTFAAPTAEEQAALPKKVEENNVLEKLTSLCKGKVTCTSPITVEALGDPYADCGKMLDIGWRCFAYDTLHTQQLNEGDTLTLDCSGADASIPAYQTR